jgi:3-deoxy-D-manno-octulosonate 8-phosphate phosphatase (KDO 8-P phosphatase)
MNRLRRIRCLLLDVDGVLTDGKIHFTSDGKEFKSFDAIDGLGIKMAQEAGLLIGFISGRRSSSSMPNSRALRVRLVRPAISETSTRVRLPTSAGSMCS